MRFYFLLAIVFVLFTDGPGSVHAADIRDPKVNEIREFGLILKIEDAGYPIFIVSVELTERDLKRAFDELPFISEAW